jgi:GxxExxY protein
LHGDRLIQLWPRSELGGTTPHFEGLWFKDACRADIVVDKAVIIVVKAVTRLAPAHRRQLMTYLRLLDCRVGLLLNSGEALMKDGIVRVVNGF